MLNFSKKNREVGGGGEEDAIPGGLELSWKCLNVQCRFKHQQDRHFPSAFFFFVCAMRLSYYKEL